MSRRLFSFDPRDHKETADLTQIGSFFAFFVISVVKNLAAFGMPHTTGAI
jgi:hypothetical protein